MKPPNAGKGRPKGSKNKHGLAFKQDVLEAHRRIGGIDGLAAWAAANRSDFYKIAARLIPTEVVGPGEKGEHLQRVIVELHPGQKP